MDMMTRKDRKRIKKAMKIKVWHYPLIYELIEEADTEECRKKLRLIMELLSDHYHNEI